MFRFERFCAHDEVRELGGLRSDCWTAPAGRGRPTMHMEALRGAGQPVFDRPAPAGLKTLPSGGTVRTCTEVPFSRQLMRQPSRSLPRTHKTGFWQRCCSMARPLVVLMLIAAQRSSPRSAQPHSQGDARRDSGGAASHWSMPEPLGPAEARRGHQRS